MDVDLLSGWFPLAMQALAAVGVAVAAGRRARRWHLVALPAGAGAGLAVSSGVYAVANHQGLQPDSAPITFWLWVIVGSAVVVWTVAGARSARWWQRLCGIVTVPLCVLCVALTANQWSGYYPTADRAWSALTDEPLPGQTDTSRLTALRTTTAVPERAGRIVAMRVPTPLSRFHARTEYVYLPPVWFDGPTPPRLPAMVMIGGVVNTPQDWVRSGNAARTADAYARSHGGRAPILVFVDPSGDMTTDTECVDGPRGHIDTHIADEVRPWVIDHFHASASASGWSVVGWSMGGTCAVDLTVRHPDLFATFADISGDVGPNVGDRAATTLALYGGRTTDWARFDPATVMRRHGPYVGVAGWFDAEGRGRHTLRSPQITAASRLSDSARAVGITVVDHEVRGRHVWSFAAREFPQILAWVSERAAADG